MRQPTLFPTAGEYFDHTSVGACSSCGDGHHLVDGLCHECRKPASRQTVSMFAEPETAPTPDLITVYDAWGKRCRVSRPQYESGKTMLRMYNQYGQKLQATDDRPAVCIHRANIARIVSPSS